MELSTPSVELHLCEGKEGGGWHVRAKAGSLVALYLGALSLCVAPPSLAKFVCCGDGITKANKVCENWPHGK